MDINVVSNVSTESYSSYKQTNPAKAEETAKQAEQAVVYEKGEKPVKTTYTVNKMSAEERSALVDQLKADQEARQKSLLDIVGKAITKQAQTFTLANGADDDSVWKIFASGKFEVDEATKKQAQEDISEDGYWGVKQTAQRLFDFASALAGDDVSTMKKMQQAMERGFGEATKSWGKELPEISGKTHDAATKLFEDYYKSKEEEE